MIQQQRAYREEAFELLGELENALLELEEIPDNEDLIGRVFRVMHTIKGSGAMFGFDDIAAFTHEVETVYDLVRDGNLPVTKDLIDLSLAARDLISEMLNASEADDTVDAEKVETIVASFQALLPSATDPAGQPRPRSDDPPDDAQTQQRLVTYRIRFQPSREIFQYGTNPILLLDELSALGECHIMANTGPVPVLDRFCAADCYVFWDIVLTTDKGREAIDDVFVFVDDSCRVTVQEIYREDGEADTMAVKKLGEILVERGDLSPQDVERTLKGQKRIGELLAESGIVSADSVASALVEQAHIRKMQQKRQETAATATLRVDAGKLDALVDLVGELVTVQARLSQRADVVRDGDMLLIAEEVERLVAELRDNTMGIRMRPIGSTFSKFKRLVRDLSDSLGKDVALVTEGGETELDKTVIEQLNDPLVHIIRNSIDHGIESPAVRTRAGKSAQGTVRLVAAHVGANVEIRIEDDGAGLDAAVIRNKAVEKGIIAADADLGREEIFHLIFAPGFSTAQTVTGVSGRGVGMDVVKKSIENLRGGIDIGSAPGQGTTIVLKLPLTLAIIDGFMVRIDDGYFVFPLAAVEECVELPREEMALVRRRNMMNIRGGVVPYLSLRRFFGMAQPRSVKERIVVAESGGQRVGFGVDAIIGQHQTVIKSLGSCYRNIDGISGGTILGDGTVALILDVARLMDCGERSVNPRCSGSARDSRAENGSSEVAAVDGASA